MLSVLYRFEEFLLFSGIVQDASVRLSFHGQSLNEGGGGYMLVTRSSLLHGRHRLY